MKKSKLRLGAAALALAALLTACGGSSSSTPASSATPAAESAVSASSVVEAESSAVSEAASESGTGLQSYVIDGVTFIVGDVPNDVTGNWRFATVSEGVDMTQYAVEYYKQCFGDDSEIHFIIDDNSGTTTKLAYMFGNIDVLVKEHVKDEEFDAKTLGNGDTLAEYFVDVETGEVEKVS